MTKNDNNPKRQRLVDVLYTEEDKQKMDEINRRTDEINAYSRKRRGMEDEIAKALDNIYQAICDTQKNLDVKVNTNWLRGKCEELVNKLEPTEDEDSTS